MERIRAVASASIVNPYAWSELRNDILSLMDRMISSNTPSSSMKASYEYIQKSLNNFERLTSVGFQHLI